MKLKQLFCKHVKIVELTIDGGIKREKCENFGTAEFKRTIVHEYCVKCGKEFISETKVIIHATTEYSSCAK